MVGLALALVAALALSVTTVKGAPPADDPPGGGALIGGSADCLVRQGGWGGYRVNSEFVWYLPEGHALGQEMTVSGTYTLRAKNPTDGEVFTFYSNPYGFLIPAGSREVRAAVNRTTEMFWVFNEVEQELAWSLEQNGTSGTQIITTRCTVEPPPAGKQPVTSSAQLPKQETTARSSDGEEFVEQSDPSPIAGVTVTSSLYCLKSGKTAQEVNWGIIAANEGAGGEEGVLVSGSARALTRKANGKYEQVEEKPFGFTMFAREQYAADGSFKTANMQAARLEVDWRVSIGNREDPNAPVQHILRTTACE